MQDFGVEDKVDKNGANPDKCENFLLIVAL